MILGPYRIHPPGDLLRPAFVVPATAAGAGAIAIRLVHR
jgi:hypothetical protein